MTPHELIEELGHLGIDATSYRVLALLPLVQVAWADGRVQVAERRHIVALAEDHGLLEGDGARILEGWLRTAPTTSYHERGNRVLRTLVDPGGPLSAPLDAGTILQVCEQVARAAGGLFGVLWTVDAHERAAIARIAQALSVSPDASLPWTP